MKKLVSISGFILMVTVLILVTSCETFEPSLDNPVEGWAVLAEKDKYDARYKPDMPIDYIDITRMGQALESLGWTSDHIHNLYEFNKETLQAELDWLEENADKNDVVLMYITAHGYYLRDGLGWRNFFVDQWEQIPSQRRVLVVDSSFAALFTDMVASDTSPNLSVAAVDMDEHSWKGIEEEGLPIIGGVFTYYFSAALNDPNADTNNDGLVSVQEAAMMADEHQRTYFHEVILAVPEFVNQLHAADVAPEQDPNYPHVKMDDTIGEPLYFALDAYH